MIGSYSVRECPVKPRHLAYSHAEDGEALIAEFKSGRRGPLLAATHDQYQVAQCPGCHGYFVTRSCDRPIIVERP